MTRRQDRACDDRHRIILCVDQLTPPVLADLVRRGRYTTTPDGHRTQTMSDGMPHGTSEYVGVEAAADKRAFGGTEDVRRIQRDPTGDDIRNLFHAVISAGADAAETLNALQPAWTLPVDDDSAPTLPWQQEAAQAAIVAIRACVNVCTDQIIRSDNLSACQTIETVYGKMARAMVLLRRIGTIETEAKETVSGHQRAGTCLCCDQDVVGGADRIRSGFCGRCFGAWRRDGYPDRHQWEWEQRAKRSEEAA